VFPWPDSPPVGGLVQHPFPASLPEQTTALRLDTPHTPAGQLALEFTTCGWEHSLQGYPERTGPGFLGSPHPMLFQSISA
jgi:hypothetical protein